jgi:hypothetical protein
MLVEWNAALSISETSYRHSASEVKLAISMPEQLLDDILHPAIRWPFGKPSVRYFNRRRIRQCLGYYEMPTAAYLAWVDLSEQEDSCPPAFLAAWLKAFS